MMRARIRRVVLRMCPIRQIRLGEKYVLGSPASLYFSPVTVFWGSSTNGRDLKFLFIPDEVLQHNVHRSGAK